ncbi:MAG: molybdopterin-dependent oxidoreductase [Clostridiales Family XIII bacterium]|nr:molybdopterin-dependent oxidoreductase [Clostridiales Family XIII bacterium]
MAEKKKRTIILLCVVVALAVLLVGLVLAWRASTGDVVSDGTLRLTAGDTPLKTYTYEEICAFPTASVEKTITSSKEADESGVFTGVPLELLLDDADPGWRGKYTEFLFHASDGFVASVFLSDIEKGENVLVVYEKDGAPLPGPEEGGKGPLRIVVADDPFGNRSAYLLTGVEAL